MRVCTSYKNAKHECGAQYGDHYRACPSCGGTMSKPLVWKAPPKVERTGSLYETYEDAKVTVHNETHQGGGEG